MKSYFKKKYPYQWSCTRELTKRYKCWGNQKKIFEDIYSNNTWGDPESRSGTGSNKDATSTLLNSFHDLIQSLEISSVVDVPCGDVYWIKTLFNDFVSYSGMDIVEELIIE